MIIVSTKPFIRQLADLIRKNNKYKIKVARILKLMDFDLRHPSLRIHKIKGVDYYSVSVDMKIRILYEKDSNMIRLIEIGNHDEVY